MRGGHAVGIGLMGRGLFGNRRHVGSPMPGRVRKNGWNRLAMGIHRAGLAMRSRLDGPRAMRGLTRTGFMSRSRDRRGIGPMSLGGRSRMIRNGFRCRGPMVCRGTLRVDRF